MFSFEKITYSFLSPFTHLWKFCYKMRQTAPTWDGPAGRSVNHAVIIYLQKDTRGRLQDRVL